MCTLSTQHSNEDRKHFYPLEGSFIPLCSQSPSHPTTDSFVSFYCQVILMVWIYYTLLIYFPVIRHSYSWVTRNKTGYKHSYTSLFINMFSFLLGKYLGVKLLGHMIGVWNCQTDFQHGHTILYPTGSMWEFQLLHIFDNVWYWQAVLYTRIPLRFNLHFPDD